MRRLALVVNPASGHGRGGRLLGRIMTRFQAAGVRVDAFAASSWADAQALCVRAVSEGRDGLVVVGGDGMAHLGHNACAMGGGPLGIIPTGTGNDFARAVGIPPRWGEAVDAVIGDHTRTVDLMAVTGELHHGSSAYVGSVISTGFDALVAQRAERLPVDLGAPTYGFAVLQELRRFSPLSYTLEIDEDRRELSAMLVAVANAGIFGGGIRIAPDFDLTDGLLDVTIVHPVPRRTLLALFPRLFTGSFVSHPAIERIRAATVRVDVDQGAASADGEPLGRTPLTCSTAAGALRVFVPAE
ncbi:MAG: diacylglycerol/lipid kinase family protein [Propioniciclava sp.]